MERRSIENRVKEEKKPGREEEKEGIERTEEGRIEGSNEGTDYIRHKQ